jgi:hypothetical protein
MIIKNTIFLLTAFAIIHGSAVDTIKIGTGTFGSTFYYKDRPVRSRTDLKYLLIWSPMAYSNFKATRPLYLARTTSLTIGASLIGFSLVQGVFAAFSKAPFYWQAGAIGVGGVALSLPLHIWYNRTMSRAVDVYNREVLIKSLARGNDR